MKLSISIMTDDKSTAHVIEIGEVPDLSSLEATNILCLAASYISEAIDEIEEAAAEACASTEGDA